MQTPRFKRQASEQPQSPDLDTKFLPSRRNGRETFEAILNTAGELLAEVGFERLTTNLVSERAGMTPPALYRYFPNKYALLAELARRLMEAQDEIFLEWLAAGGLDADGLDQAVQRSILLRKAILNATQAFPGGMWILRAMNADPALREVRVASRELVLNKEFEYARPLYPDVSEERLWTALRMSEQASYGMVEMLLEDPDLDEDKLIEETAWMTCLYFNQLAFRFRPAEAHPLPAKRSRKRATKPTI